MELNTQTNRQDVEAIALDLLSRDPVLFNSALNAYFAADARYLGHALDIRGVSAIKHVAWTFNLIDWGRGADVPSKKVSWDRNAITATIETQRHLRPVFFPLFTAAVPVKTRLHFNLQREKDSKCLKPILYVTLWEDEWPLGKWLQTLPLLGSLVRRVFTPVASFVITLVSNLVFSIFAWLNSAQPRYVSQSIEGCITYANRASDLAPRALRSGFNNGAVAARGRGHQAARLLYSIAHKPLILVGSTARSMTSLLRPHVPFNYPQVSMFDHPAKPATGYTPLEEPIPIRAQQNLHAKDIHSQRIKAYDVTNPRGAAQHAENLDIELPVATATQQDEAKVTKVEVGAAESGNQSQSGPLSIPALQFNDAKYNSPKLTNYDAPPKIKAQGKPSLFDDASSDEKMLKKAEAAAKSPLIPKQKKSGESRNVDHRRPLKFEEGLSGGQLHESNNAGQASGARTTPTPMYQKERASNMPSHAITTNAKSKKKKKKLSSPA